MTNIPLVNSNLHEEFEIKDEDIEIEEKETVNSSDKIKTKMAVKDGIVIPNIVKRTKLYRKICKAV